VIGGARESLSVKLLRILFVTMVWMSTPLSASEVPHNMCLSSFWSVGISVGHVTHLQQCSPALRMRRSKQAGAVTIIVTVVVSITASSTLSIQEEEEVGETLPWGTQPTRTGTLPPRVADLLGRPFQAPAFRLDFQALGALLV